MGKQRKRSRSMRGNGIVKENNTIKDQQQEHHRANQTGDRNRRPPKLMITVLLENGISFVGTAVTFDNPKMPKCKLFFKTKDRRELAIETDVHIRLQEPEKLSVLQSIVNNHLLQLHEEANMEFPAWLEKYSAKTDEANPFFNLDEIREEFKYKKSRFGAWRVAAQLGFFDDMRPQFAKFNRIVRLEILTE